MYKHRGLKITRTFNINKKKDPSSKGLLVKISLFSLGIYFKETTIQSTRVDFVNRARKPLIGGNLNLKWNIFVRKLQRSVNPSKKREISWAAKIR